MIKGAEQISQRVISAAVLQRIMFILVCPTLQRSATYECENETKWSLELRHHQLETCLP
jgi:hypothetical protein